MAKAKLRLKLTVEKNQFPSKHFNQLLNFPFKLTLRERPKLIAAVLIALFLSMCWGKASAQQSSLSDAELALLASLSSQAFYPLRDPTNRMADNADAANFGKRLFNSTALSKDGKTACASCHIEALDFQDNLRLGSVEHPTRRKTPMLAGAGHALWYFWDGRKDSLWSQSLAPLEDPIEHGLTRTEVMAIVGRLFRAEYENIFGKISAVGNLKASPLGSLIERKTWVALPESQQRDINFNFANLGKAIAAYIRSLPPTANKLDAIAQSPTQFSSEELAGFRLFTGKAACSDCHAGAMLTDSRFHNTGVPQNNFAIDRGRAGVFEMLDSDPFHCGGAYSDAGEDQCGHVIYALREESVLLGAFKTPSLRGVSRRKFFMHSGAFENLTSVIEHYNSAPKATVGTSELEPLNLTEKEKSALLAFLKLL
jgi:cytochrome c peroxidase